MDEKSSQEKKIVKLNDRKNEKNMCENHYILSETAHQKKGRPTNEQRKSHGKITISNGLRARETTKRRE